MYYTIISALAISRFHDDNLPASGRKYWPRKKMIQRLAIFICEFCVWEPEYFTLNIKLHIFESDRAVRSHELQVDAQSRVIKLLLQKFKREYVIQ
jgi:hypothetical protein